jgi:hypothetical protein
MKIIDIPQSGKLGTFITFHTRHGQIRRPYKIPADPRTAAQLLVRGRFGQPSARWRTLTDDQRAAWRSFAAMPGDGLNLFVHINANLTFIGLDPVAVPPARALFSPNPVGNLAITNTDGVIALELPLPTAPAQYTLVWATAPCSPGVFFPPRFYFIGLLPAPIGGFSDITALYVARFGVPPANRRVFIRTQQQISGWRDTPKQTTFVVPSA